MRPLLGAKLNGTPHLKEPLACTAQECKDFARLVRQGFDGSDVALPDRIQRASLLAFLTTPSGKLAAIAALKVPEDQYVRSLFEEAGVAASSVEYTTELGWVFVVPEHRGNRIAEGLCRELLAHASESCVFATTREGNASMGEILSRLGFRSAGKPCLRGNRVLDVFLRP